jgi:hypothetical protein
MEKKEEGRRFEIPLDDERLPPFFPGMPTISANGDINWVYDTKDEKGNKQTEEMIKDIIDYLFKPESEPIFCEKPKRSNNEIRTFLKNADIIQIYEKQFLIDFTLPSQFQEGNLNKQWEITNIDDISDLARAAIKLINTIAKRNKSLLFNKIDSDLLKGIQIRLSNFHATLQSSLNEITTPGTISDRVDEKHLLWISTYISIILQVLESNKQSYLI